VEDTIRSYITTRYKLAPSLIAAGQHATHTGFPFVARADMFWPEHAATGAANSTQYIFLNDTLVAPIWAVSANVSSRTVWVPPGQWEDVWDGSSVEGPKMITATQPFERQPMWHRKGGGLIVLTDSPGLRIDDGNWSTLTLEAWPAQVARETRRSVFALRTAARTDLIMRTNGDGTAHLNISAASDSAARAWILRVHLVGDQRVTSASLDGVVLTDEITHLVPLDASSVSEHFPFGGSGARPPPQAGHIAEVRIPRSALARGLQFAIAD
jgi:hypothetical protein